MRINISLVITLLSTLYIQILSQVDQNKSYLQIVNPSDLRDKFQSNGFIQFKLGNFGKIPYGSNIFGRIFWSSKIIDNSFCDRKNLPTYAFTEDPDNTNSPIVLVDSSEECSLATKAYNVESIGGSAMLLVSRDETFETKLNYDDPLAKVENIPTVIIRKSDGDTIKDFIKTFPSLFSRINMLINFENVKKEDSVDVDYFLRSDNSKSYEFFREFLQYYKEVGETSMLFEPHYKYNECIGCTDEDKELMGCTKDGKFCGALNSELAITNATLVLEENVRQKCIWYLHKKQNPEYYWKYMINFKDLCMNTETPKFTKECSVMISNDVGVNFLDLNICIDTVINKPSAEVNFLDHDKAEFLKQRVTYVPKLLINKVGYKGSWYNKFILSAICQGFKSPPKVCTYKKVDPVRKPKGFGYGWLILIVVIITAITLISVYCYKRMLTRTLDSTIEDAIKEQAFKKFGEYKALSEVTVPKAKESKESEKINVK